jgi:glucokinase
VQTRSGYLAIDLSPSRLAAGVIDLDGNVVVRDRVATPARSVWPALTRLVSRVLAANKSDVVATGCGVTCPGPVDRGTGAMKPVGLPDWHDYPLRRELRATTGLDVEIDTAGRGLALAEMWLGEAALLGTEHQQFATLALGDEVYGALVVRGRLMEGLTGNLGQFGHLIVEPDGVECSCGATGCLTAYAGARSIEASTGRELGRTPAAITERTGIMVARACASLAAMLDVSDIVIGGIVPSVLGGAFFDALEKELDQRSRLSHLADLRVRGIGESRIGPLVGAAAVARHAPKSSESPIVEPERVDPTDIAPAAIEVSDPS